MGDKQAGPGDPVTVEMFENWRKRFEHMMNIYLVNLQTQINELDVYVKPNPSVPFEASVRAARRYNGR